MKEKTVRYFIDITLMSPILPSLENAVNTLINDLTDAIKILPNSNEKITVKVKRKHMIE